MIETLLDKITASPVMLNNICELPDGTWRANLIERNCYELDDRGKKVPKRTVFAEFGSGKTALEALTSVWNAAQEFCATEELDF